MIVSIEEDRCLQFCFNAFGFKEVSILGKKIFKRSLVMSALMAFVITGNVYAADLTLTTSYDEITDKYTVKAAPNQSYLQDIGNVGSGDMYYTANSYNDNKFILMDEIRYHRGLLLAVGFYRDDTYSEAVEKHIIKNNIMNIINRIYSAFN